jgi:hypothetical protein
MLQSNPDSHETASESSAILLGYALAVLADSGLGSDDISGPDGGTPEHEDA